MFTNLINQIKVRLARIPSIWRTAILASITLFLIVLLWFYGMKVWNGIGNWFYHHSENDAKAEINAIKSEAANESKLANEAIAAYEASKLQIAEEQKRREIAEKILAERGKTTDAKLQDYENAVRAVPNHTGPESSAELCQRARALGLAAVCD